MGKNGVTLVELIVVISIISLLALLVAPQIQDFKTVANVNGAARQIISDMQLAKTRAVFENRIFAMTFNSPSSSYTMRSRAAGDTTAWSSARVEMDSQALPSGVVFNGIGFETGSGIPDANSVIFRNTGSSNTGQVIVMPQKDVGTRADRMRQIKVQFGVTGKIKALKNDETQGWVNF